MYLYVYVCVRVRVGACARSSHSFGRVCGVGLRCSVIVELIPGREGRIRMRFVEEGALWRTHGQHAVMGCLKAAGALARRRRPRRGEERSLTRRGGLREDEALDRWEMPRGGRVGEKRWYLLPWCRIRRESRREG